MFVISLYLTFPFNQLRPLIESKMSAALHRPITFKSIDTHYITGIELDDLAILDTAANNEPIFKAEKISVFINPFSLIMGSYSGYFGIYALGGITSGSFSSGGSHCIVDINFKNINPKLFSFLVTKNYVIDAKINGSINGDFSIADFTKSNGSLSFDAKKFNIEKLSLSTPLGPFAFPELSFSSFITSASLKDENMDIKKIELEGKSAKIYIRDGIIKLANNLADARLNLKLEFSLDDELKNRFGVIVDQFCSYNTSTNLYSLKLSGSLLSPTATK